MNDSTSLTSSGRNLSLCLVICSFFVLGSAAAFSAGGVVKNGGGSVSCVVDRGGNRMIEAWSTDFLLTGLWFDDIADAWRPKPTDSSSGVSITPNWEPEYNAALMARIPKVAFAWYLELYNAATWYIAAAPTLFAWQPLTTVDLPNLGEIQPEVAASLPSTCQDARLRTYILRELREDGGVIYRYAEIINSRASELDALQRSFLLTHEWLWNFTNDPVAVRNANRFLHSQDFLRLSSLQVSQRLLEFGIDLSDGA